MDSYLGEQSGRRVFERADGTRYVVLPDGRALENGDAERAFTPEPGTIPPVPTAGV